MAQVTGSISINNGAATPVAKAFAPERVSPDSSVFTERSAAVSAGFIKLATSFSPANSQRPTTRVDVSLDFPVLQTVNGISSVAYKGLFKGYFVIPDQMTAAERADLAAFVANSLDVTLIRNMIKDLDPLY